MLFHVEIDLITGEEFKLFAFSLNDMAVANPTQNISKINLGLFISLFQCSESFYKWWMRVMEEYI